MRGHKGHCLLRQTPTETLPWEFKRLSIILATAGKVIKIYYGRDTNFYLSNYYRETGENVYCLYWARHQFSCMC